MKTYANLGLKAICASLLISLPFISVTATAEPMVGVKQNNAVKKLCVIDALPSPGGAQQPSDSSTSSPQGPTLNITLVNQTNANVCYQALQYTGSRSLIGKTQTTLKYLPTPVTVTFYREDGGLLRVDTIRSPQSLTVIFRTTGDFASDRQALSVDPEGKVSSY